MFDMAVVEQMEKDVGADLLPRLYSVFKTESETLYQQILQVDELDTETVRLCHSLKSSAKTYGAIELARISADLEDAAKRQLNEFFNMRQSLHTVLVNTMTHLPVTI